jgi:hypothetical protein
MFISLSNVDILWIFHVYIMSINLLEVIHISTTDLVIFCYSQFFYKLICRLLTELFTTCFQFA